MLFGMLGGALSALASLYMTGKKLTNTLWFNPRLSTVTGKSGCAQIGKFRYEDPRCRRFSLWQESASEEAQMGTYASDGSRAGLRRFQHARRRCQWDR
jgi:hypothetical protein